MTSVALAVSARRETDYYKELGSKTNELVFLASVLISIMAIGAIFAVANTLYAAVDSRKREIAMVRTLGFGRLAVVTSFTLESLLICIPACVFGLLASLAVDGVCLTVARRARGTFTVEVMGATRGRTTIAEWTAGRVARAEGANARDLHFDRQDTDDGKKRAFYDLDQLPANDARDKHPPKRADGLAARAAGIARLKDLKRKLGL